ncbi:MAG: YlxR family protein [Bacillota bacterium]
MILKTKTKAQPKIKKIPLRRCLGCNEMKPKSELVRVVKNSSNEISVDMVGKMQGRGAYVCKKKECLEKAIKTKRLEREFGGAMPTEIFEKLRTQMEEVND